MGSRSSVQDDDDLTELRAALRVDARAIAEDLLGPPNKGASTRREIRWGKKAKIALKIDGPYKGLWRDFSDDTHGDILEGVVDLRG